jgi:hypothetical protein
VQPGGDAVGQGSALGWRHVEGTSELFDASAVVQAGTRKLCDVDAYELLGFRRIILCNS